MLLNNVRKNLGRHLKISGKLFYLLIKLSNASKFLFAAKLSLKNNWLFTPLKNTG